MVCGIAVVAQHHLRVRGRNKGRQRWSYRERETMIEWQFIERKVEIEESIDGQMTNVSNIAVQCSAVQYSAVQ